MKKPPKYGALWCDVVKSTSPYFFQRDSRIFFQAPLHEPACNQAFVLKIKIKPDFQMNKDWFEKLIIKSLYISGQILNTVKKIFQPQQYQKKYFYFFLVIYFLQQKLVRDVLL